jgi:hypothetical protein
MQTESPTESCRHHWVLGQPQDGLIAGFCRGCREERTFPAYIEDYGRGHEPERQPTAEELAGTAAGGARLSRPALLGDPES